MITHTRLSHVEFRRPFRLTGLDGLQPPGIYTIESYSELLDTISAVVSRRLSTSIELHAQPAGIVRRVTIDPAELETALKKDADEEASPQVAR